MALFKPFRGNSSNLPVEKTDGFCYFTLDEHLFYIDYTDSNGQLQRACLGDINQALSGTLSAQNINVAGILTAQTPSPQASTNVVATKGYVDNAISSIEQAIQLKGAVNPTSFAAIVTQGQYKIGWAYLVDTDGTYAGKACQVGDLLIAKRNASPAAADRNNDWTIVDQNIESINVDITIPTSGANKGKILLTVGINGVSGIAEIPAATENSPGIVTTENQTFSGQKTIVNEDTNISLGENITIENPAEGKVEIGTNSISVTNDTGDFSSYIDSASLEFINELKSLNGYLNSENLVFENGTEDNLLGLNSDTVHFENHNANKEANITMTDEGLVIDDVAVETFHNLEHVISLPAAANAHEGIVYAVDKASLIRYSYPLYKVEVEVVNELPALPVDLVDVNDDEEPVQIKVLTKGLNDGFAFLDEQGVDYPTIENFAENVLGYNDVSYNTSTYPARLFYNATSENPVLISFSSDDGFMDIGDNYHKLYKQPYIYHFYYLINDGLYYYNNTFKKLNTQLFKDISETYEFDKPDSHIDFGSEGSRFYHNYGNENNPDNPEAVTRNLLEQMNLVDLDDPSLLPEIDGDTDYYYLLTYLYNDYYIFQNEEYHKIYIKTSAEGQGFQSESHNIPGLNQANGDYSFAEGFGTNANGHRSHAEGTYTNASGTGSHTEGTNTTASGNYSHAEGQGTTTNNNLASGAGSHVEGYTTQATGDYSHAEGRGTLASGYGSHAEGRYTIASGHTAHASGWGTQATHKSQNVFGEYNILDESSSASNIRGNYIEIVGNGSSANNRSNARTLDWNGNETIYGNLTTKGSLIIPNIESGFDPQIPINDITITNNAFTFPSALVEDGSVVIDHTGFAGHSSTGAIEYNLADSALYFEDVNGDRLTTIVPGSIETGQITITGQPTEDTDAVTKKYVDNNSLKSYIIQKKNGTQYTREDLVGNSETGTEIIVDDSADNIPIKSLQISAFVHPQDELSVTCEAETVLFNQINPNGNNLSGWTANGGSLTSGDSEATLTVGTPGSDYFALRVFRSTIAVPKAHRFVFLADVMYPKAGKIGFSRYDGNAIKMYQSAAVSVSNVNTWTRVAVFGRADQSGSYTATNTSAIHFFPADAGFVEGDVIKIRNVSCIDLTAMFGEGNEPTTIDDLHIDGANKLGVYWPTNTTGTKQSRAYGQIYYGDYISHTWTAIAPEDLISGDIIWDVMAGKIIKIEDESVYNVTPQNVTTMLGYNRIYTIDTSNITYSDISTEYHLDPTIAYENLKNVIISLGGNI